MTIHGPYTGKVIVCRTYSEAQRINAWIQWVGKEREHRRHMRHIEQAIRKTGKTRHK
jgi:hypothetical protein